MWWRCWSKNIWLVYITDNFSHCASVRAIVIIRQILDRQHSHRNDLVKQMQILSQKLDLHQHQYLHQRQSQLTPSPFASRFKHQFFIGLTFYRAMHHSAKRGIAIACRLSVCLSVTLVDQEHIGWKSWKLIARTISPSSPKGHPFIPRGTWGNLGRIDVGSAKVACWSTKAAISLKRVKIDETLLWRAYRNSPTLFRTLLSPTSYSLLFTKIGGSQPPSKTSIAIISRAGKAADFKCSRYIHKVHPNKTPLNILVQWERGRIQGLPKFLDTPIISGNRKATNFKFCTHIRRIECREM